MSTKVMSECWPLQMPPTPKSVLISLADNANDHGVCWPAIPTIAERTCFSERAVQNAIKWLESNSLVVADRSNGRHTSYRLTPAAYAPPQQIHPAGGASVPPQEVHQPPQEIPKPPQEVPSNRKEPSRTVKVTVTRPDEIPESLWRDWLIVRKGKRAELTATAMVGFRREAEKAGLSLESAITLCCESGWASLKASWLNKGGGGYQQPHQTGNGRREL